MRSIFCALLCLLWLDPSAGFTQSRPALSAAHACERAHVGYRSLQMTATELEPPPASFGGSHVGGARGIPQAMAGLPTTPSAVKAVPAKAVPAKAAPAAKASVSSLAVAAMSDPVRRALSRFEADAAEVNDNVKQPQLTPFEFALLIIAAGGAAATPLLEMFHILDEKAVEILVPTAGAITAAIGISAEYKGKIAVSNGKEVAAVAVQAAAEAEAVLAQAERVKSVIPACVGVAAAAGAGSLLAPAMVQGFKGALGIDLGTVLPFTICPIIAVAMAMISARSTTASGVLCKSAMGVGVRRVSRPGTVGDTWQSVASDVPPALRPNRWKFLAWTALPAPLLAGLYPDQAFFKAIIAVAIACSQCAFSLATAEYNIARAVEAVSLKARTAAIADCYANQGMKSGAILPFTSALCGLSVAACAAVVEVNPVASAFLPAIGGLVGAAASVSKARAEIDAEAAATAATELGRDREDVPIVGPLSLLQLTLGFTMQERVVRPYLRNLFDKVRFPFRIVRS